MILSKSLEKVLASSIALAVALTSLALLAAPGASEPFETTTTLQDLPVNRALAATAVIDGKLYVIGGCLIVNPDIGSCVDTVMIYDIATGEVTYGDPMPTAVAYAGFGLGQDGNIYVAGGWTGGTYNPYVQIYDPEDDSWTTSLIGIPDFVGRCASTFGLDGNLYIFGGGWSPNVTLIYSPDTDSWDYGVDLPIDQMDGSAVAISPTEIMLLGGITIPSVTTDEAWIYNTVDDEYTAVSSMNLAKRGAGAAMARNGYVYSFGGTGSSLVYGTPQYYEIERYDIAEDTWTVCQYSSLPYAASNFATAVDEHGRIFLVGGQSGASVVDYVQLVFPLDVSAVNSVEISSPGDGSYVNGIVPVVVSTVNYYYWSLMVVDFYVDGTLEETQAPGSPDVTFLWDTAGLGDMSSHVLMVRAFTWGGSVCEDSITVIVLEQPVEDTIEDLQSQIDDLKTALNETNASLSDDIDAVGDGVADMSDQVDTLEDKADSANLWAMLTMVLVVVVLVLLLLMFLMGRKKTA
jgi:N-acetylneuraminic acid mutarotase